MVSTAIMLSTKIQWTELLKFAMVHSICHTISKISYDLLHVSLSGRIWTRSFHVRSVNFYPIELRRDKSRVTELNRANSFCGATPEPIGQRDIRASQGTWTLNICITNATLYHWAKEAFYNSQGGDRTHDIKINSFALLPTELPGNKVRAGRFELPVFAMSMRCSEPTELSPQK